MNRARRDELRREVVKRDDSCWQLLVPGEMLELLDDLDAAVAALEHAQNVLKEHLRKPGSDLDRFMKGALETVGAILKKIEGGAG